MAKLTVLEITQDILNDMDSDPVNSINDTEEALQIAQIIKTSYFSLMCTRNWPHLMTVTQLNTTEIGDTNPVKLLIPALTKEMQEVYYNVRKVTDNRDKYTLIDYMEPERFLRHLNARNSNNSNIETVIDYDNTKFFIRNDVQPSLWTSFDDEFVMMDSYDSDVDSTLQSSKTQVILYKSPVVTFSDTFVPDLPEEAFPALIAEAKSTSFLALKQVGNAKAEQRSRKDQAWLSRKAWKARGGFKYPNFGRRGTALSTRRDWRFDKN